MKNTFYLLLLTYSLTTCTPQPQSQSHPSSQEETVTKYYQARNDINFEAAKKYISDSITVIEGSYTMPYNYDSFYEVFKWDSIFQPTYEVVEIIEKEDLIFVNVTLTSARNQFLKNTKMICQYRIEFEDGKISEIESMECSGADWNLWQNQRDSLVNWISINHPNLDGFINDMTMDGAINYMKAIELYKKDKKGL